jgi:hypothetical protein
MSVKNSRKKTTKKAITVTEIELAIARKYGTREHIIVPNISWGFDMHECDMFIIKRNGYAVEVEIKRTKGDLLADFKKKHEHKSNKIREFYYAIPEKYVAQWMEYIPEHAGIYSYDKHEEEIWDSKARRWTGKTKWVVSIKHWKDAKINKTAMKLTVEEQFKIARLGCLRIWNLKQKLIKK